MAINIRIYTAATPNLAVNPVLTLLQPPRNITQLQAAPLQLPSFIYIYVAPNYNATAAALSNFPNPTYYTEAPQYNAVPSF